jgi:hypothetical protein
MTRDMQPMTEDMQPMTVVMKSVTSVMLILTLVMLTMTLVMPILTAYTYALSLRRLALYCKYSFALRIRSNRLSSTQLLLLVLFVLYTYSVTHFFIAAATVLYNNI